MKATKLTVYPSTFNETAPLSHKASQRVTKQFGDPSQQLINMLCGNL